VSRGTTYSEAAFDGTKTIEGVTALLVTGTRAEIFKVWKSGELPLVIDPRASMIRELQPDVVIDATMAKGNNGTTINDAPLVIGMGPGFYAGRDVHIIIETNHSNNLGRVITEGEAENDTGTPVALGGLTKERVIWAPRKGTFTTNRRIGDKLAIGDVIGKIERLPLRAPVDGILRGLIRDGVSVTEGTKMIEIDPINDETVCYIIRDKMRAIAGGVLEAIMMEFNI
jgi:xanthine dehydrogenase accessory factor